MPLPSPASLALALLGVGLGLGCGCDRDPGSGKADQDAGPAASSTEASSPATRSPSAHEDPYTSFEALRPEEHASWPVENVDIQRYAGWRIDPGTGGFALEEGLVFDTARHDYVLAIASGRVLAVERDDEDVLSLTVDHGEGIHSHYAPLTDALVHAGMPVARGTAIGLSSDRGLRLRLLVDQMPIDPALALRQPLHRWPARLRELPPPPPPPE